MHLSSTINPLSKSEGNVPVALVVFEEQRKFIRVSEDYKDTIERVCRAFSLRNDSVLSIHTTSLDVCKGAAVEIDESAYPLMWTVLDEITVRVVGERVREQAIPTPRSTPYAETSSRSQRAVSGRLSMRTQTEEEEEEEEEVAMGVNADAELEDGKDEFVDADEGAEYERQMLEEAEAAAEAEALAEAEAAAQAEAEAEAEAAAQADAEAEAAAQAEADAEAAAIARAEAEAEAAAADLAWDFADEQPKKAKETTRRSTSRSETTRSTPPSSVASNKFRPTRTPFDKDDRSVKSDKTVTPWADSTSRSVFGSKSPRKEAAAPSATADADPRFEITIVGPDPYQIAQFKTRGKHPARKVLAAACKLFELDYDTAHLYLGDASAKGTRGAVKCEVDATMTQCGVNSNSRLYVRVNNGRDELDEDDEEDA